jgi:putative tryptophan/tyrosine transport system substrate-binding protein
LARPHSGVDFFRQLVSEGDMGQFRRRQLLVVLGTLFAAQLVRAQSQGRIRVIGFLWNDSIKPSPYATTLVGALNEQGLVAGRDFRIDDRVALEGYGSMADGAASLVRGRVDLIVAYGSTATLAAAKATREIPIVTIIGTDPVEAGLAKSLAHPGRNVTGVVTLNRELVGKRFALLKELVPGLSKVAILIAGGSAGVVSAERNAEAAARTLGMQPHVIKVNAADDLDGLTAELQQARAGGLYVAGNTMLSANASRIVSAVAKHRIPAVYSTDRFVDAGGLMVYGPSIHKSFARTAVYIDRLLKGAKPGELPFQQVQILDLTINMKAARAQEIKIPHLILLRADRVIE